MSSKMTLFYVIFENWAFYINVRISEAEVVVIWNLTLLLQEHLTVLKKADAEPKKGRSKKKAIIELHP